MKSLHIEFDFPDGNKFHRMFNNLEQIPDDFSEPLSQMADDFYSEEERIFNEEGPGWAPLKPEVQKRKERKFPGAPILVRTGALKASLTSDKAKGSVYELTPDTLKLGTSLKTPDGNYNLGLLHQFGAPRNNMPARPPIQQTQRLQRSWENRMATWLREEIDYKG